MLLRPPLAVAALAALSIVSAQTAPALHPATIAVTVTDAAGASVTTPLTLDNFRVFEDGKAQKIEAVSAGPGPVSVAVVLDTAENMIGTEQRLAEGAIQHLVAKLSPEDEIAVVMPRQQGKFMVVVPWTRGGAVPKIDWSAWTTLPFSDLLNGVRNALFTMDRAAHPRRAVLAVMGLDEVAGSWTLPQYVVTQKQSESGIYAFQAEDVHRPGPRSVPTGFRVTSGRAVTFEDLMRDSGGRRFALRAPDEGERAAEAVLDELRKQYVIRFQSTAPLDGTYHRLKVELKDVKDLKVRHRAGYLAKPPRT